MRAAFTRIILACCLTLLLAAGCDSSSTADCTPATCESLGVECGTQADGCEGSLQCGDCPAGLECEAGLCVPETCTPATCESLGVECGVHDDLCGSTVDCGPCSACPDPPSCFVPDSGPPDAPVVTLPGDPPELAAGEIADFGFELRDIEVYADDLLDSSMEGSVELSSNGNTHGAIGFLGWEWGLDANLDLQLVIDMGEPVSEDVVFVLQAGGCFELIEDRIVSDVSACEGQWPDPAGFPQALAYQVEEDGFSLLLVFSPELIISRMPAEYQDLAAMFITGDLPVLMHFAL